MPTMKRFLRSQLEQRSPAVSNFLRTISNPLYFRRTFSQHQAAFRALLFPPGGDIRVQTGPFKGLRYLDAAVWGSITPKWLGSYEAELHPIVQRIAERSYQTIIDVGCAEGYYAVGLAVLSPGSRVFAFDTDFISRAQVRRLAALNKAADRVRVGTFCRPADVDALSVGRTLVVCDIEGFERQLLDPQAAQALLRDDILVEVHEATDFSSKTEDLLHSRFAASHRIERIVAADRGAWIEDHRRSLPGTILPDALRQATEESRATGRVWLWMQANLA